MKKLFIAFVILAVVATWWYFWRTTAIVQAPADPKKISVLVASDLQLAALDGFKVGMAELGYQEGKDIVFDVYNPKGDKDLTNQMVAQIVASVPDLIITFSTTASVAAKEANQEAKINMVFADVGNFSRLGIENPQHPGGFMTGLATDNTALGDKRVEILKEAVPSAKTFALINNPESVNDAGIQATYQKGAKAAGVQLKTYPASDMLQLKAALTQVAKDKPDGFLTVPDALVSDNAEMIAQAMREAKIPSLDFNAEKGAKAGFLLMYGISRFTVGKEGARVAHQVLNGVNPGDIPVEFARDLSLEINSVTARAIGINLPQSLLLRANKIYE